MADDIYSILIKKQLTFPANGVKMTIMKKRISAVTAMALAVIMLMSSLSGCSLQGKKKEDIVTIGEDSASLKVGMVTDSSGIDDRSFNQSAWEGLKFLNANMGAKVGYIEAASTGEYKADLELLAKNGYGLCWGVGYTFADAIVKAAKNNPDTCFAIIDYECEEIPSNLTCATFRVEEAAFLAGYIAGSVTQSGKVGFIGGMDVEAMHPFQFGYLAGVAYSDNEKGKKTEPRVHYLDGFEDSEKGAKAAKKMYDEGCDVIFHAAGGAGIGVIETAAAENKYVIGVDCDQSYLAPDNVLTSVIKKVDVVISNISVQYEIDDNIDGASLNYGLSEYALDIPEDHRNYSDEVYERVLSLKDQIIYNEIEIPKDKKGYDEFVVSLS